LEPTFTEFVIGYQHNLAASPLVYETGTDLPSAYGRKHERLLDVFLVTLRISSIRRGVLIRISMFPSERRSPRNPGPHGMLQPGDEDDVADEHLDKLPAHVESVKEGLLNFHHFLGLQAAMLALENEGAGGEEEDTIPLYAYKPDGANESQRAREREFVQSAQLLARVAQSIEHEHCGLDANVWQRLLQTTLADKVDNDQKSGYVGQISNLCAH
jgi:hypothetical protein